MIIFFILFLFLGIGSSLDLSIISAEYSRPLQKICENLSENMPHFRDIQQSLLCGTRISDLKLAHYLKEQSLIHLFIVSGGHFLFLEKIFNSLGLHEAIKMLLLFLYNILTGFQAPGTRVIGHLFLKKFLKSQSHFLRTDQQLFLSNIFLLSLFPTYFESCSFLLSSTAALALCISSFLFFKTSGLKKAFLIQTTLLLILSPWLCAFGNLHPLGILTNLIIGPYILFILFPLSGLIVIMPILIPLFQQAVIILSWILSQTSNLFLTGNTTNIPITFFWIYLLFLHVLFHIYQVRYWQESR